MKAGLILDGSNTSKANGSIVYAKNKVMDYLKGTIRNEDGLQQLFIDSAVHYVGVIETPEKLVIFYLETQSLGGSLTTNYSVISTLEIVNNSAVITPILATVGTNGLNFSKDNPIQGEFTFNANKELNISFIEGIKQTANPLRYLNVDNTHITFDAGNVFYNCVPVDNSDINNLASNRTLNLPLITFKEVLSNGMLPIGVYTLYVAYSDKQGNRTNYINSMNPVTIYESNSSEYINIYDTDDLETIANKAINILITNLDVNFNNISIGLTHQINGAVFAYEKTYDYDGTNVNIVISDVISMDSTSPSSIYINNLVINKVNAITKFDKELLIGNVTTQERIDYSDVANSVVVKWKTDYVGSTIEKYTKQTAFYNAGGKQETYKNEERVVNNKTFQFDEVYALYIQAIYVSGELAEATHIPGPPLNTSPVNITTPDGITTLAFNRDAKLFIGSGGGTPESDIDNIDVLVFTQYEEAFKLANEVRLYQVENFAYKEASGNTGLCGVWVNNDEVYPVGHPNAGTKVRHFRMPDYNIVSGTGTDYESLRLSLDITNVDFSAYPDIQGYNILIAKRDVLNHTVVDEGALYNSFEVPTGIIGLTPNQLHNLNWGGQIVNGQIAGVSEKQTASYFLKEQATSDDGKYFLYAPKTFKFNNPTSFSYLKVDAVLIQKPIYNYRTPEFVARNLNNYPGRDLANQTAMDIDFTDFTEHLKTTTESTELQAIKHDRFLKVTKATYIQGNTIVDNIDMEDANSTIYIESDKFIKLLSTINKTYNTITATPTIAEIEALGKDMIFAKVLMKRYTANIYKKYGTQQLAKVGTALINSDINVGGDSYYSGVAMRVNNMGNASPCLLPYFSPENFELRTPTVGSEMIHTIPTPMYDNYWKPDKLCNEYTHDWNTDAATDASEYRNKRHKWLGKHALSLEYWGDGYRSIKHDWAKLNDMKSGLAYDIDNNFLDKFPYRVFRSLPVQTENLIESWRIFEPTNYEELDNARGEIMTLNAVSNALYVRQKFALVAYRVVDATETTNTTTALGRGAIFATRGTEVIGDTLGYIGSNSRFNSLATPYGYFVVDVVKQEVYKVNGTNAIPITIGVMGFIKTHLRKDLTNPYKEGDYILGYNDKDKMLLLTCNDNVVRTGLKNDAFTLSYPMYNESFFSFHDYIATMFANTSTDTFSLVNNGADITGLYRHSDKATKCLYYTTNLAQREAKSDILDTLFNGGEQSVLINKLLDHVEWITDAKRTNIATGNTNTVDETVSEMVVYSDTQCTGVLPLSQLDLDWYDASNGRNIQNKWSYNNILDSIDNPNDVIIDEEFNVNLSNIILKDYYDLSNFIGTFVVVRLIHNNIQIGTDEYTELYINIVNAQFSKDNR